jgi:hypothetical protein
MSTNNKSPMQFAFLGALGAKLLGAVGVKAAAGALGAKVLGGAVVGGALAGGRAIKKGSQKRKDKVRKANQALRARERAYMDIDITNPYMGLTNAYAGMENVAEDLTVNQEAARFQAEQGAQQRANIMQQLRGAAGTSGIAGLAQSLAQQQTMQARQISTSIAEQESANERMRVQEASRIQQMQRGAEMQIQQQQAYGDLIRQQREMAREETLLAGAYSRAGFALDAQTRYREGLIGGVTNIVGAGLGAALGGE